MQHKRRNTLAKESRKKPFQTRTNIVNKIANNKQISDKNIEDKCHRDWGEKRRRKSTHKPNKTANIYLQIFADKAYLLPEVFQTAKGKTALTAEVMRCANIVDNVSLLLQFAVLATFLTFIPPPNALARRTFKTENKTPKAAFGTAGDTRAVANSPRG